MLTIHDLRRGARLGLLLLMAVLWAACESQDEGPGVSQTAEGRLVLGQAEQTRTMQRSLAPEGRTVVLDGFRGTIDLEGVPAENAMLDFKQIARGRNQEDAQNVLQSITLEESGDAGVYQYVMRTGDRELSRINIQGDVPHTTNFRIDFERADINLTDVYGPVDANLDGGSVRIAGARQFINVRTQNGPIRVGYTALPDSGEATLQTQNGDIVLALPENVNLQVQAQTGNGDVITEGIDFAERQLNAEGAGMEFTGRLRQGGPTLNLRTQNGTITIRQGSLQPPLVAGRQDAGSAPETTSPPPASEQETRAASADTASASTSSVVGRPMFLSAGADTLDQRTAAADSVAGRALFLPATTDQESDTTQTSN